MEFWSEGKGGGVNKGKEVEGVKRSGAGFGSGVVYLTSGLEDPDDARILRALALQALANAE